MDYSKHYHNLIRKARERNLPQDTYKEHHHIIPRCMGGDDELSNLVYLLPEEHLIAHILLIKIYPDNQSLHYAAWIMRNRIKSNKHYGWLKRRFSCIISTRIRTCAERQKISNSLKEYYKTHNSPMKGKNHPWKGHNMHSIEYTKTISERQTKNNTAKSPETRKRMSLAAKQRYQKSKHPMKGKVHTQKTIELFRRKAKARITPNRKKKFTLISPSNERYCIEGNLREKVEELQLSLNTLKQKFRNQVVPQETREQYSTTLRENTTGWTLLDGWV